MRENIKTIKYTSFFSVLFALLTYFITLNMEIGFFQPNWSWMSNNFALTACGGVFASFFVVMLCEVQKYRSNRMLAENYLYTQTMYLYSTLYCMQKNIDEYLEDKSRPIPDNLVDERIIMIRSQSMAIRSVDYVTFCKNNALIKAHQDFCFDKLMKADSIISGGNYLKIAIIQTQMKNLEETYCKGTITSADEMVAQTLIALKNQISPLLDDVSAYLKIIDDNCNGRYNWANQKAKIQESYISLFKSGRFEDFIAGSKAEQ